jgi:hypothetical protein
VRKRSAKPAGALWEELQKDEKTMADHVDDMEILSYPVIDRIYRKLQGSFQ